MFWVLAVLYCVVLCCVQSTCCALLCSEYLLCCAVLFWAVFWVFTCCVLSTCSEYMARQEHTRVSICIFVPLEQFWIFSFTKCNSLWQLLQSPFSVNWGSESAMDTTFLNFVVMSLIFFPQVIIFYLIIIF